MKPCNTCGLVKPLNDYYAQPRSGDGRQGKYKDCVKRAARVNYRRNREHYVEYERRRCQTPARKAKALEYQRARRAARRDRYKARTAVGNAVRDGRLVVQPCEVCGSHDVQAHHEDYSKPLGVMWLCFEHHRARHGQQAEATEGVRSFKVRARGENDNSKKEAA